MRDNWYWDLVQLRERVVSLRRWVRVWVVAAAVGWFLAGVAIWVLG